MAQIKYFIYSSEQFKFRQKVEAKMGRKFKTGYVVVNGIRKPFTELSSSSESRFADAKVVAEGNPDFMTYTLPKGE